MARILCVVRNRDTELRGLAGEDRFDASEAQLEADEVALALVHRHEAETGKYECQYERQVVVVVHRTQQHGERHQREDEAHAGWQDVDATRS